MTGDPTHTHEPRPGASPPGYLTIAPDCVEDADWPGLCSTHEVHHLPGGTDWDPCRGEVPRRH